MKQIKLETESDPRFDNYIEDIRQIQRAFANFGYAISEEQAFNMWGRFSDEKYAAGWLGVYGSTDAYIFRSLEEYWKEA